MVLIQVLAILFIATFIRSAFGFGEALISVPLLSLFMPVNVAAPVAVLVSITVAAIVIAQDWRHVHFTSASKLFIPTIFGTPLGLLLLMTVSGAVVKIILGTIIGGFSIYCLLGKSQFILKNDRLAWAFGFVAGIMGGAYGMNGPPLVIYGSARRWPPQHFRATLQGYFLPASMIVMAGYWFSGLWTAQVSHYYLLALLPMLIAILLGRLVNKRMKGSAFLIFVHIGLILTGAMLLIQAISTSS